MQRMKMKRLKISCPLVPRKYLVLLPVCLLLGIVYAVWVSLTYRLLLNLIRPPATVGHIGCLTSSLETFYTVS